MDRVPSSPDSEAAILGSLILDATLLAQCEDFELSAEHFHTPGNRVIYSTISEMREEGLPIDELTLQEALRSKKQLANAGGAAYIANLTSMGHSKNLRSYIRILKQKWSYREIMLGCERALAMAGAEEGSPAKIAAEFDRQMRSAILTESTSSMFSEPAQFFSATAEPEWLVKGVIERGSNGFICGDPKASKSLVAAALALSLALKFPWLGFPIARRTRTALISREDNPAMTTRRLKQLSHGFDPQELKDWLWVNTKQNTAELQVDNPAHLAHLIREISQRKIEFVILDVLNVLHSADENDNTEMRKVMHSISRIHTETGAQLCVLHHWNKGDGTRLTKRMRGASSTAGFAEWIVGVDVVDEDLGIRKMQFDVKGGENPKPVYYSIVSNAMGMDLQVETEWRPAMEIKPRPRPRKGIIQ